MLISVLISVCSLLTLAVACVLFWALILHPLDNPTDEAFGSTLGRTPGAYNHAQNRPHERPLAPPRKRKTVRFDLGDQEPTREPPLVPSRERSTDRVHKGPHERWRRVSMNWQRNDSLGFSFPEFFNLIRWGPSPPIKIEWLHYAALNPTEMALLGESATKHFLSSHVQTLSLHISIRDDKEVWCNIPALVVATQPTELLLCWTATGSNGVALQENHWSKAWLMVTLERLKFPENLVLLQIKIRNCDDMTLGALKLPDKLVLLVLDVGNGIPPDQIPCMPRLLRVLVLKPTKNADLSTAVEKFPRGLTHLRIVDAFGVSVSAQAMKRFHHLEHNVAKYSLRFPSFMRRPPPY